MIGQGSQNYVLKILLIGNSGVGKTCLLTRFTDNRFSQNFYNTVGVDYAVKYLQSGPDIVKLQIWDTAGQQRFRTMSTSYYRGAHGIVIAYDITDRSSFINIESWWKQLSRQTSQDVSVILVGNKNDMGHARAVSYEEGRRMAAKYGIPFMETSAKTGNNVAELFGQITAEILENGDQEKLRSTQPKLKIPKPRTANNCWCC